MNAGENSRPHNDSLKGKLILIVDDAMDNQSLLRAILQRLGARIELAGDGAEGVRKALHVHPDAVIMDIQMPKMDGFEATHCLRRLGFDGPIIALTARGLAEDRHRSLQSGANDHLTKPLEREKLIKSLSRCWEEEHVTST